MASHTNCLCSSEDNCLKNFNSKSWKVSEVRSLSSSLRNQNLVFDFFALSLKYCLKTSNGLSVAQTSS